MESDDIEYKFGQKFNYVKLDDYIINKKPVYIKVKIDSLHHDAKHPIYHNTKAFERIAKSKIGTPSGSNKTFYFMTGTEAEAKKQLSGGSKKKTVKKHLSTDSQGKPRKPAPRKAKTAAKKKISGDKTTKKPKPKAKPKAKGKKAKFGCARPGSCSFGQHPTPLSSFWGPFAPSSKATSVPDTKKSAFGNHYTTGMIQARYGNKFGRGMYPSTEQISGPYDGTVSKTTQKINTALNQVKFGTRSSRFGSRSKFGTRSNPFGSRSNFGSRISRFGCGSQNRFGIPYGAMQYGRETPRY